MVNLPPDFTDKMKKLLGEEYDEFMASYDHPRNFGLRVNVSKVCPETFSRLSGFHLQRISWTENGFYYEEEDHPARHPFYYAGLYYLQEPSAMTPASVLKVHPGEKVLDLCAAPGGKATELGARLMGKGVLVANDISASRAKALLKNIEIFGIPNVFVTNETPAKLAGQFPSFFDKILVDAPCSGEGMFRKDPAVAKVWDKEKPFLCAKQQREIIGRAARMLAPGGQLLYSTCTFSPEENEQTIAYLLDTHDDMEVVDIPHYEGFSCGIPWAAEPDWMEQASCSRVRKASYKMLEKCVRIWPHKMDGEGHFLALLQKKKTAGDRRAENPAAGSPAVVHFTKQDKAALTEFFADVSMEIDWNYVEIRKGQAYYVPKELGNPRGLTFLRNGLYLGEIRKDRFEPSQSFAMALKKEEYAAVINLNGTDERVVKYLKGETIEADDLAETGRKGWQLVCVEGYPLGWGKLVNGTLKNKYHAGWRMKY